MQSRQTREDELEKRDQQSAVRFLSVDMSDSVKFSGYAGYPT